MTARSAKADRDERTDIEKIVAADHRQPFAVLGMHEIRREAPAAAGAEMPGLPPRGPGSITATGPEIVVRAIHPRASAIQVVDGTSGRVVAPLDRVHPDGFFEAVMPGRQSRFRYRLRFVLPEGTFELEDPYRFPPALGELDLYLLGEGTHLRNYEKLGAHPMELEGVPGTSFTVWAPNARRVSVVGEFNGWDGRIHQMRLHPGNGIWEIFIPHVGRGARYKFEIKARDGKLMPLKADPYAFFSEVEPNTASVVNGLPKREWRDQAWIGRREAVNALDAPISIYEIHLGSWQRDSQTPDRYLTYRELADRLIPYVKHMGFTHIELLPISEHPFGGSWGYQPIGLYAATSRFGRPEDFQFFMDRCHQAGIGVLVDWVPGHFPTDTHGLGYFDGTHLYEHADPRKGFHTDWNTLIYNYGRREVANFLLGNALFWLEHFHIDGLRVDAVASMLYLDYSRKHGEWIPNQYGGNENLEAIDLLKRMNQLVPDAHPGCTTIAEESTAWPAVSRPVKDGGLGFNYKWNMGWMHDTLRYMSKEAVHRRWHHHDLTFGLLYAFSENFVLPLSHDEVVHGKGSMINKMPGDEWQKFANLRAYYAFMWTHPGKKLLFMGGEIAQWREWNHNGSLDWHLLEFPRHAGIQSLVRDLNTLYRETPALHQLDCDPAGFEWIHADDSANSVISYLRKGRDGVPPVMTVCNFTPVPRPGYRIGVPAEGFWVERLNTDAAIYGGSNTGNAGGVAAEPVASHGRPYSVVLTLPPLATIVLQPRQTEPAADGRSGTTTASASPPAGLRGSAAQRDDGPKGATPSDRTAGKTG